MTHTVALTPSVEFYGKLPPSSGECREVFLSRRGRRCIVVFFSVSASYCKIKKQLSC